MDEEKKQYIKEKNEYKKALIDAMYEAHANRKEIISFLKKTRVYTEKEYKFISQLIWGGTPVDKDWAIQTKKFEDEAPIILNKYPYLDKSFYETNKK